ncbi:MAG: hypothetical protein SF051_07945, partial [Elusimicrobiota bacterium]|nr:hypothetical protein [Elusimicrobiota bacterium]
MSRDALRRAGEVALVVSAVLLGYSECLVNGFAWDDHLYVTANPFLADPANARHLLSPGYYLSAQEVLSGTRPVFLASLLADRALYGLQPWGHHLTSVLLHAANSLWVYALAGVLVPAWPLPLFAGLIFALHPLQVEAVAGVSFRATLLAAFFVFAALWTHLRARGPWSRRAAALVAASAALFGLGLLSKETAACLPLLLLLVEWAYPAPDRARRLAWTAAAYAPVAAAYAAFWARRFRYEGMGPFPAAADPRGVLPGAPPLAKWTAFIPSGWEWAPLRDDPSAWVWTHAGILAEYARLVLLPYDLVADRAPAVLGGPAEPRALLSAAALAALAAAAWHLRRRRPGASFGVAWFFATLLPVAGLLPVYAIMAERYLYIGLAGAAWAA